TCFILTSSRTRTHRSGENALQLMRVLSSPWLRMLPVVLSATTFLPANAEQMPVHQRIAFPDVRLEVFGLPWFSEDKPALRRLPLRLKDRFRSPVWDLAQDPSGGRIRFRTDSTTIVPHCGESRLLQHASHGQCGGERF